MKGRASLGAVLLRAIVRLGVGRARRGSVRRARAGARSLCVVLGARARSVCWRSRHGAFTGAAERQVAPSPRQRAARPQPLRRSELVAGSHAIRGANARARNCSAQRATTGARRLSLRSLGGARARCRPVLSARAGLPPSALAWRVLFVCAWRHAIERVCSMRNRSKPARQRPRPWRVE